MTTLAIRIAILSAAMAIYIVVGFRGVENNILETIPSFLMHFLAFAVWTVIAVPIYKMKAKPDEKKLGTFAIRFWAVTSAIVAAVMLIYAQNDVASQGMFTNNLLLGIVILIVMIVALNYIVSFAMEALLSSKRRMR